MAQFAKVNGTAQPVFHMDVGNGSIAGATATAATPVNFQGPKLDFFSITANASVATQQGINGYVSNVLQAIQQTSTVAVYQVDGAQISVGVFPTGAFSNVTLATAVQTANGAIGVATANVVTTGFKLATA
jgi:hypothetical protein